MSGILQCDSNGQWWYAGEMREPHQVEEIYAEQKSTISRLRAALEQISSGNWNFGNARPGMTIRDFAREALEEKLVANEREHGRQVIRSRRYVDVFFRWMRSGPTRSS